MEKIKIALLGLGTVGTGVWNILKNNKREISDSIGAEIEVSRILVKDKSKKRMENVPEELITTDFDEILKDKSIKLVVEVIGGVEPAFQYILKAIESGKHIVTANKLIISKHGSEIANMANKKGVRLKYEASVCGAIPIINLIKGNLSAEKITEVIGILNGTTNYILTKMTEESCSLEQALKEAQDSGFAEADPSSDIEGYDALYKLKILSKLAYGIDVNESLIYREGISRITQEDIKYAKELGYRIKLLAISRNNENTLELKVHPALIPESHFLAKVNDSFNAVLLKGNAVGELIFYGRGAGKLPTGSAVVGDIVSILRKDQSVEKKGSYTDESSVMVSNIKSRKHQYYLRFTVQNRPEAINKVIDSLESKQITISRVFKKPDKTKYLTLLLVTQEANEGDVHNALKQLDKLLEAVCCHNIIRIESFGIEDTKTLKAENL